MKNKLLQLSAYNGQYGRNGLGQKVPLAWVLTDSLAIQIARLKVTNSLLAKMFI
jgi:hypothetical protein